MAISCCGSFSNLTVNLLSSGSYRKQKAPRTLSQNVVSGEVKREDFVETIANYLVKTDAQWNNILLMASQNGKAYNSTNQLITLPDDGIDGQALILQKLEIARK